MSPPITLPQNPDHLRDDAPDPPGYILEWFRGKTEAELDAIFDEERGRLMWPDTVKVKIGRGEIKQKPCMLRTPTAAEKIHAVIAANAEVAKLARVPADKQPITRSQAEEYVGSALYGQLHTAMVMSFAIREPKAPYSAMWMPQMIINDVGLAALEDLYTRLDAYKRVEDIRLGDLDEDTFVGLVLNIARVANLTPLVVCDGFVGDAFIVRMAQMLAPSLRSPQVDQIATPPSSSESSETSTPG